MINRNDLAVAAILLAACGALYYVTTTFEEVSPLFAQDMPPERFPRMLLWLIAALAAALPFEQRLRGDEGKKLDTARKSTVPTIVYLTAGFLALTVVAIPWIGTSLVLVAVCLGLPLLWGERRWKLLVPFLVLFPWAVMMLFAGVLGVHFDAGVFGLKLP